MLQELRVENLLLIEHAELHLSPGLNVLTGETGAGKTVLAHALDLMLGGRARAGIVRPGAREAYVEGVFDLSDELRRSLGDRVSPDAAELVLARRVGSDGRTRAVLNGRTAAVGDLRDIGGELLAFYGQHEHRRLTLSAAQTQILDELCGSEHPGRLRACAKALERTRTLERRREELRDLQGARERELDLVEYELAEIESVAPHEGEDEQLLLARERLRRLDALRSAAGAAAEALAPDSEGSAVARPSSAALAALDALAGLDPRLDALADRMRTLEIESQDIAAELRRYCDGASSTDDAGEGAHSPDLDTLEERLTAIERLMRKHGGSIRAVLDHAEAAGRRRSELLNAEVALEQVDGELAQARADLQSRMLAVRKARTSAGERLAVSVREQLASLGMGDASFEVSLGERDPGPGGADRVEFVIAPNPGVPAGPLREIASGGELSRVMLAIMSVAAGSGPQATLVFDEVDAGIGGHTARAVGARLRGLAEHRQVLCITHLPQIASLGERHFSITKDTAADPTRATVIQLAETDVVSELVRMLGADTEDSTARRHARELRRAA